MKKEIRDNMIIEWDVEIKMDDGVVLRADVFRPIKEGKYPVILSYGPYGKGLHFSIGYPFQWQRLKQIPEVFQGSSGKYMNWETVDPEKWVPDGYVIVRVDSRGAGRSEGFLDPLSSRETKDLYNCIEWAAEQPWSNGKIGLAGISYYAINQWAVASLKPPHLAAICPWEAAADFYRDMTYHGGIPSTAFWRVWYENQVVKVQHGVGERGPVNPINGELVAGPETLPDEELRKRRVDMEKIILDHPLYDQFHKDRSPDWSKIEVPLLSCGNWGGLGLHLRGNVEGFIMSASKEKWLEIHGREHWIEFYTNYGVQLQKKFFDYYLKGIENGWKETPRVILWIRHVDGSYKLRAENEWPIGRTRWTKLYLNPENLTLEFDKIEKESNVEYESLGDGVTFLLPPLQEDTEITGPISAKLFISSSTSDADIFLTLRAFSPSMKEVFFYDYLDPHTPLSHGWLRASHRKLDERLSTEWRPYHTHDELNYLTPNEIYELDIELWPTCVYLPKGYRIGLTIGGKDFEYSGEPVRLGHFLMSGSGPFYHEVGDFFRRPKNIYGGKIRIYGGKNKVSYLLLPIVPPRYPEEQKKLDEKISWLAKHMRVKE